MPTLFVYLHTHWDREWYSPFEVYRADLVAVVDGVCAALTSGDLPSFYLDGQSCALEDAVELRPDLAPRIVELMAAGKLAAGPWYVLADQMLVSGESLVRNLKVGLTTTRKFGEPTMVGYCPDTFGHSQDLPRILSGFGIESAVVWRGVPPMPGGPAFRWVSPDGSSVLAYHLRRGYYQTALNEMSTPEEFRRFFSAWMADTESGPLDGAVDGALFPAGGDHVAPPAGVAGLLAEIGQSLTAAGRGKGGVRVEAIALADFLERRRVATAGGAKALPDHCGELRSNSHALEFERAFLLSGVLSTRLYLKRANRLSEGRLFGVSEPLHAYLSILGALPYPARELDHALRQLLKNQPHDSICGCSVDAVHEDMVGRTRSVNQVLDALDRMAEDAVADAAPGRNGTPLTVAAERSRRLSFRDPDFGANRLFVFNAGVHQMRGPVRLSWVEATGRKTRPASTCMQIVGRQRREELFAGMGAVPYYKEVELLEGWVWAGTVPGVGVAESPWPPARNPAKDAPPEVTVTGRMLDNGLIRVEIDAQGDLAVTQPVPGGRPRVFKLRHRLKDVGDGGDTYNFDPIPNDKPVVASVRSIKVGERGPLVASLAVVYELKMPDCVMADGNAADGLPVSPLKRSARVVAQQVETQISIRRGVPMVFFDTSWNNQSTDHRLSLCFDTGSPVGQTVSENHFSLVRREHAPLAAELPVPVGHEAPVDTHPCQRFFMANGQLFLNGGLPEYAVDGTEVLLTILRSVTMLSRGRMRSRGGGAGPHLPTPGAACPGVNTVSYGWAPLPSAGLGEGADPDLDVVAAYELAEEFEGRLWPALVRREDDSAVVSLLSIDNPAVRSTAVYGAEPGDSLTVRLLNVTMKAQRFVLSSGRALGKVALLSLDDREIEPLKVESGGGAVKMSLGANELATVRLTWSAARG